MEYKSKPNSFKKLLDRLQENSWELELLISGFAIFGLFYSLSPIAIRLNIAENDNNQVFVIFLVIVHFALQILIFNLLLHILARGLWIGSLGLRYVFGDIDFEALNYSEQFTKYLQKKVGSFDSYISKLENFCSVIFALSFLLIFYVFSFFSLAFLIIIVFQADIPEWAVFVVQTLFGVFSLGVILTFIDFISQGLLKKNKWVAKIYFPFYWVFSFLTLSFLYRPLIYNLLDNKQGRRISFSLIPVYFLVYFIFHLGYQKSNFITRETFKLSNRSIANSRNYQDEIEKNQGVFIGDFAIQSKVIHESYIKLIVPLRSNTEDELMKFSPSLKPEKDKRGLQFEPEISLKINDSGIAGFSQDYLKAFERQHSVSIDGVSYTTEFVISKFNNQFAFESYIWIQGLPKGKHTLNFKRLLHKDSDSVTSVGTIPFWYFNN